MKNLIKDILLFGSALILVSFIFLGITSKIPNNIFIILAKVVYYLSMFVLVLVSIIESIKNPKSRFSMKTVELVQNIFTAFLTASILVTFFWKIDNKYSIYLLTLISFIVLILMSVNQIRRDMKKRYEFKEWFNSFMWTFSPAILTSFLIGSISKRLEGSNLVIASIIFAIILFYFYYKYLNKK